MPQSAASDLFLHCLPMSHKKDARLKWVNSHATIFHKHLQADANKDVICTKNNMYLSLQWWDINKNKKRKKKRDSFLFYRLTVDDSGNGQVETWSQEPVQQIGKTFTVKPV